MGFRTGAYAKVWEVKQTQPWCVDLRISTARKDKKTDSYVDDFSGFVRAVGADNVKAAAALQRGDRIRLGDVDVTSKYDADKKKTYTNFALFSFEMADGPRTAAKAPAPVPVPALFQEEDSGGSEGDDCLF